MIEDLNITKQIFINLKMTFAVESITYIWGPSKNFYFTVTAFEILFCHLQRINDRC